ncbi:MAG: hypothetical protein A2381_05230 [Bdellovibrionales bacterium RIFOXYB1_FULL_37_110]|nr:MAG: hypothetical protein A2417_16710 [Bdellovibrionales bacterium RIFOXYC1_FULL_37_79]OFZ58148.1 MAG: hypothetical protein A2381_05230 [Bdellovibrionales bacterium RIFOXYB1_FULL_37_110]OFZ61837.1 MAG: hypothetical protein A2577_18815 [Bdellovibrionales bacterium RIFOXYD1_FULL_36_51]
MKLVRDESIATTEVNRSKFIAHLFPFEHFKKKLDQLKTDHPKARHFVYAYRYFNELNQIVENQSDDGEPKGSSGRPVLNVLRGNEMINTAIIIVRYFGGTKLGVGGLVRAYTESVHQVLQKSNLLDYKRRISKSITVGYRDVGLVEHILKQYANTSWEKKFAEKNVEICFNVDEEDCELIMNRFKEICY